MNGLQPGDVVVTFLPRTLMAERTVALFTEGHPLSCQECGRPWAYFLWFYRTDYRADLCLFHIRSSPWYAIEIV